mgnify:CR=1 FL=1
MLTRNSQIGEFYVMSPPQIKPPDGGHRFTCDMMIYDEESDRHVRIEWGKALEASLVGGLIKDYGGTIVAEAPGTDVANHTLAKWHAKAVLWQTYNEAKTEKASQDAWTAATADEGRDVRIVVSRPFIEHLMHNVIMTVSGRDTGATLFGPADMQLSANTQVKTIEGYANLLEHTHTHIHTLATLSMPYPHP